MNQANCHTASLKDNERRCEICGSIYEVNPEQSQFMRAVESSLRDSSDEELVVFNICGCCQIIPYNIIMSLIQARRSTERQN